MWHFTGKSRPNIAIEPAAGQESVWDYPRPPKCVGDQRNVRVLASKGVVIADSLSAVRVLETASPPTFYVPREDVNNEFLVLGSGSSYCEWKGRATYWSVKTDNEFIQNAAWSYESPSQRFRDITGFVSFYPAKLECLVDRERVRPQPGGFYGGWVTDEIAGPFKGEPGTSGW